RLPPRDRLHVVQAGPAVPAVEAAAVPAPGAAVPRSVVRPALAGTAVAGPFGGLLAAGAVAFVTGAVPTGLTARLGPVRAGVPGAVLGARRGGRVRGLLGRLRLPRAGGGVGAPVAVPGDRRRELLDRLALQGGA